MQKDRQQKVHFYTKNKSDQEVKSQVQLIYLLNLKLWEQIYI
jgi:hypothetical protein